MYIRVKTSNNGTTTYVQIVQAIRKGDKVTQKIVRHVGVAKNAGSLEKLKMLASSMKETLEARGQQFLFKPEDISKIAPCQKEYDHNDYDVNLKDLIEEQRLTGGFHDVYGTLYEQMGYAKVIFNASRARVASKILKDIVIARIANPASKRASALMLEEDFGITIDLDKIYRMMDKIDEDAIRRIKNIAYKNTLSLLGQRIDVIFYDATTLYFESFSQDELKQNGFGKDGKFGQPQVLLALMVTDEGLPIDYEVFAGSTYEGHTLANALDKVKDKYEIKRVVFVADSAMLSDANMARLQKLDAKISFIVGARIKNVDASLKKKILDSANYINQDGDLQIAEFLFKGKRLIVSYSKKRAKKDACDRAKAVEALYRKLDKSKSAKSHISNHGYRKYLKISSNTAIEIDEEKIAADSAWDGLHGVVTNSDLGPQDILKKYSDLWNVEAAFRVTKHDLAVRPIFHWKPDRVRAHIAICFMAYSLVKNLEYRVALQYKKLSIESIRASLARVQTSVHFDKRKKIRYGLPSMLKPDAKKIYKLMGLSAQRTPYIIEKCEM
jgi:transposase